MDASLFRQHLQHSGDPDLVPAFDQLLRLLPSEIELTYGPGNGGKPQLSVMTEQNGLCTLLWLEQKGESQKAHIRWNFPEMQSKTAFSNPELMRELQIRLNRLPGPSYSDDEMKSSANRYPLNYLADESAAEEFVSILSWVSAQASAT